MWETASSIEMENAGEWHLPESAVLQGFSGKGSLVSDLSHKINLCCDAGRY